MSKHIGIVAVSAEGAALCYQTICREGADLMGRHNHPVVSLHTYPLSQYMVPTESGDNNGLGKILADSASKLAAGGADFFICPDNTAHLAFKEAVEMSNLSWLHIADEVAKVAEQSKFSKIGITGTKYLMESDVYPEHFKKRNLDWEIPNESDRIKINSIIFDELVYGKVENNSKTFMLEVIEKFKNSGCDAVVLGCTEIPLIVLPEDSSLPTLDSTRILARAALNFALTD